MNDNFLQELLKAKLFDIGEADERLKWLKSAIGDLQKKIEKDFSILSAYTLVALDPNIADTELVLIETEKIITQHWESLRVRFADMPRNLIRGVILNALNNVGIADAYAARVIWLTALNFYPYAKLNSEKYLVEQMLNALGYIAEKHATEEWALVEEEPSLKLTSLKAAGFQYNPVTINIEDLKNKMTSAIWPGYYQNQNVAPYNQHFGTSSSNAIKELFDQLNTELSKGLSTTAFESTINNFFAEFKKSLEATIKPTFSGLIAVERRSKLLWWKETLYSPSQKRSYRSFEIPLLPILMSADLYDLVPEITPVSVDYLLRDTLFLLNDKRDESLSFSSFLTEISKDENKAILKSYFKNPKQYAGRISVTDFLSLFVNDKINAGEFKNRTGIDDKQLVSYGDLAVIVFHDLLIQYLISQ